MEILQKGDRRRMRRVFRFVVVDVGRRETSGIRRHRRA